MYSLFCSTIVAIGIASALSLPQSHPNLQLAPNHTLQLTPSYTTVTAGQWPAAPFRHHIRDSTYMNIISYPPNAPVVSAYIIQNHLINIEDSIIRGHTGSQLLPLGIMFNSDDGGVDVRMTFLAEGRRTLRRGQARMLLQALGSLTAQYGPRQIEWADVEVAGEVVSHFRLTFLS